MSIDPKKSFWRGIEERDNTPEFQASSANEFPGTPEEMEVLLAGPASDLTDRRSFLKAAGFTVGGSLALAACSRGVEQKLIPLLSRSEGSTPGRSLWYATTCGGCAAGCGVLAKSRDGRPIKIEGNPDHPLSRGGVCPVGQAALLGVYDTKRLAAPRSDGNSIDWPRVDREIPARLRDVQGSVVFLTGTITSPSMRAGIQAFLEQFEDGEHVTYDADPSSAILEAHERNFGRRTLPHYRFDQADLVVSFDADFLGTWISPVEFTKAWAARRAPERMDETYGRLIQVEGRMSLTGTNADERIVLSPQEAARALDSLAGALAERAGVEKPDFGIADGEPVEEGRPDYLAGLLWAARGRSLLLNGSGDVRQQCAANFINDLLGNYGHTLDAELPSHQRAGDPSALAGLIARMRAGEIGALVVSGCNPVYSLSEPEEFVEALDQVDLTVAFAERGDETADLCEFVLPVPHFLSAWGDAEPVSGVLSVFQPLVAPLEQSRTVRETLARWLGDARSDRELVRAFWKEQVFPRRQGASDFEEFWDRSVHDGYTRVDAPARVLESWQHDPEFAELGKPSPGAGRELVLYQKLGMLDGSHAHNAWLHELPDPVTKAVWDNYVCLAAATARELEVENGDVVRVAAGDAALELPALIQPGQHADVVAIAVGYGRRGTDRFARVGPQWIYGKDTVAPGGTVGGNAYPLGRRARVTLERTGERADLALTQTHHTLRVPESLGGGVRPHVHEATLAEYRADPAAGHPHGHELTQLWTDDHEPGEHQWGLSIDLNRCTGCSACVVACQVENNVPVVGKDEVLRRREMHWIRIDRYYAGDDEQVDTVHQPVMCQHCESAPCETVCPVLATTHSREGLNQQIYNRCIGTRYCENNCPYKVRRFNWFDYRKGEKREHLALNPDVTTRSRGVMEKCSLCVQRIQEAKAESVRRGEPLADGDIQTACQQSCSADAIVFGDVSDPQSRVTDRKKDARHYVVLEELNVRPAVGYLTKIRNREGS